MDLRYLVLPPFIKPFVARFQSHRIYDRVLAGDPKSDKLKKSLYERDERESREFVTEDIPYRALSLLTDFKGEQLPNYWHTAVLCCTDVLEYGLKGADIENFDVDRSYYGISWLAKEITFELGELPTLRILKIDWQKDSFLHSDAWGVIKR